MSWGWGHVLTTAHGLCEQLLSPAAEAILGSHMQWLGGLRFAATAWKGSNSEWEELLTLLLGAPQAPPSPPPPMVLLTSQEGIPGGLSALRPPLRCLSIILSCPSKSTAA